MSIKFPDMQVLIGRTDQIPKILRKVTQLVLVKLIQ